MSEVLLALQASLPAWISICVVLGLLVGSFLNVVIYRLPVVLDRSWKTQAREILDLPADAEPAPFNLVVPRSRCPGCGAPVQAWQNIPLVSYLVLRGRCASCGMRIPLRVGAINMERRFVDFEVAGKPTSEGTRPLNAPQLPPHRKHQKPQTKPAAKAGPHPGSKKTARKRSGRRRR